jgi:hypothetical protein
VKARFLLFAGILPAACNLWPQFQHDQTPKPQPDAAAVMVRDAAARSCVPRRFLLDERGITNGNGAGLPTCSFDANGAATLDYETEDGGCTRPEPYSGCLVALHEDVRRFVAGQGVFDVQVCVEGSVDGAVNLWLQDPKTKSAPEGRLNLLLVDRSEVFMSSCRRRWFSASDIGFPDHCPARRGPDVRGCFDPGDAGASNAIGDAAAPVGGHTDAGAQRDARADAVDGHADAAPLPPPDFGDAELALIGELCVPSKTKATPQHVKITLTSVVYYPTDCLCESDAACAGAGWCQRDPWPELACCWCQGGCPGVCSSDVVSP